MTTAAGRAPLNPVLARELRVRLRSWRSWLALTAYLVLLSAVLYLAYKAQTSTSPADPFAFDVTRFTRVGRTIFEWLVFAMVLLVLLMVPAFTAASISGERERQTLVPLQLTALSPWRIAIGKLLASFAFTALLVVATAPLLAVTYLIGGVEPAAIAAGIGSVLLIGFATGCLSVACSALFRRVQVATVASFALVLLLVIGTVLGWGAAFVVDRSRGTDPANPPEWLLSGNPFVLTADAIDGDGLDAVDGTPFSPLRTALRRSQYGVDLTVDQGGVIVFDAFDRAGPVPAIGGGITDDGTRGPNGRPIIGFDEFGNPIELRDETVPFWAVSAAVLAVLALVGMRLTITRLRTPAAVER